MGVKLTFSRWWATAGQNYLVEHGFGYAWNDALRDFCQEAWNGAIKASGECVVIDGNPQVAKEKIAELEAK